MTDPNTLATALSGRYDIEREFDDAFPQRPRRRRALIAIVREQLHHQRVHGRRNIRRDFARRQCPALQNPADERNWRTRVYDVPPVRHSYSTTPPCMCHSRCSRAVGVRP
jgi:hypothetical protein